jgi:nucleotide-binding universal stress UspA family protein
MIADDPDVAGRDAGAIPAIRRIVVATDLTPRSASAHAFAAALARACGAELCLFHVVPEPGLPASALRGAGIGAGEILERRVGEAERALRRVRRSVQPAGGTTMIRLGTAAPEIARCASLAEADIVVVGGHEPPGPGEAPGPDHGALVRERARCPVITVPSAYAVPAAAVDTGPVRRVLVASDLSACSAKALETARLVARQLDCPLEVLHVRRPSGTGPVPDGWLVRSGDAAPEIVACARAVRADLLVLGTHGRGRVRRAMLGSVARAVVAQAPCPTMTVRR